MSKILILFVMIPMLISSQYTSKNTGDWTTGSVWLNGTSPPLTGGSKLSDDVVITSSTEVTLNNNLEVQSGAILIVEGTLIVTGNITFKNGSSVLVQVGGILHVLTSGGNANNSTNVTIEGQMIVDGDFDAGTGSTITGGGSVDVGGTSSGTGTIFGQGTGCSGCSFSGGSTLPIVLISFDAIEDNNTICIYWVVASQVNNESYTIYKSSDAYAWDSLAVVPGAGNTSTIMDYMVYDQSIVYGTVYYKLRQTDYDGNYEDFPPIALTILDPNRRRNVTKTFNLSGSQVDPQTKGLIINVYSDGSTKKEINR